jgi:hypothetical protein
MTGENREPVANCRERAQRSQRYLIFAQGIETMVQRQEMKT